MTSDAVVWSSEPRRLHPAALLLGVGRMGRQFTVPAFLALFAGGDRSQLMIAALLLVGVVVGVAKWWRFTYSFDGRAFAVDEGVFNRRHRTVPVERIQQVDVEAKLAHRLFGAVALRIDTGAGSATAEVDLRAVSRDDADRLRRALLNRAGRGVAPETRETADTADTPGTETVTASATAPVRQEAERPIVRLGTGLLALGGITGPEQLVMIGILVSLGQAVDDLPDTWFESLESPVIPTGPLVVGLGTALVVATWVGLAAVAAIVKYYDFALVCRDDAVHIRRGLFDKREASLALRRLQAIAIQQSAMRRAFKLLSVRFSSGGAAKGDGVTGSAVSSLLVPVLRADDVHRVIGDVLPPAVPLPPLNAAPLAALRRALVRTVVPAALGAAAAVALWWPLGALALAAVPLAALLGYAQYRGLAHGASEAVVVARHGALQRQTVVADKAKVQSCSLETSPFQRRAGLSNLELAFAGNQSATIRDGDARLLEALFADITTARRARRDELSGRREVSERR